MNKNMIIIFLFLLVYLKDSKSYNILAIFPTASRSHVILGIELLKGLASRGHNVTMFSTFPQKQPIPNYHDIVFKTNMAEVFLKNMPDRNLFRLTNKLSWFNQFSMSHIKTVMNAVTEAALADENMQNLLQSTNPKFDAVIIQTFMMDAMFTIPYYLNATAIGFSNHGPSFLCNYFVGNPSNPSYIPNKLAITSDRMNFFERIKNTVATLLIEINIWWDTVHDGIKTKFFPNISASLSEIISHVSLVLVNSHTSFFFPQPLVPNMIEIGGFHVKEPKALPQDLQTYLDRSTNGAIYFSLGSNLKSSLLPTKVQQDIIKVFSELKQNVLWKWDGEEFSNRPKNVLTASWFPQTDILAHPNVKLFITHGGWGSVTESVQRGIPLIGIPIFGDQGYNIHMVEDRKIGIRLEILNITYESLSWAIREVLDNPSYSKNMKRISHLFNDRDIKPLDRAIYWIEYAIRNEGAKHLKTAAMDLNWIQLLLIDVIGFIVIILFLVIMVLWMLLKVLRLALRKIIYFKKSKID